MPFPQLPQIGPFTPPPPPPTPGEVIGAIGAGMQQVEDNVAAFVSTAAQAAQSAYDGQVAVQAQAPNGQTQTTEVNIPGGIVSGDEFHAFASATVNAIGALRNQVRALSVGGGGSMGGMDPLLLVLLLGGGLGSTSTSTSGINTTTLLILMMAGGMGGGGGDDDTLLLLLLLGGI